MTDEQIDKVLFEMNGKLSSIATKLDSLSESILKHEARITNLENRLNDFGSSKNESIKDKMLELMAKCLIIGLVSIASLAGAGGILTKIFGV